MTMTVGTQAPRFTIPNQRGELVELDSLRGRKIVLVFFPNAFTRICGGEVCSLRDDVVGQLDADTTLLTISTDPWQVLRHWATEEGFGFDMLSDFWPHGAIARRYGAFDDESGTAVRATFVLDRQQVVRWLVVNGAKDPRNPDAYVEALAGIV